MTYPGFKVTFLGTGTSGGVPMIACNCTVCSSADPKDRRLRSSILIETETTTVVVDTTPDFRYQMLREKVCKLDAVLFTHPHKDHIAGLDDIRAFNYFSGKPMPVYANYLTEEALRRDYYYAFSDTRYPGIPEIALHTLTTETFQVGDLTIEPILVWHLKMPVLGFRFGPFTYITDANRIEEDMLQKIRGSKGLVLNSLRRTSHLSHYTLDEAIAVSQELAPEATYFTHISHQMGLHREVETELPKGIHLAYDGLTLSF
jgi:phosphoribosyl 1,2-cyclic phosphate phosphodiesterase